MLYTAKLFLYWIIMGNDAIDTALDQVRQLKDILLRRRLFQGYSGWPRIISGSLALATAWWLARFASPTDPIPHLKGWGLLLTASLAVNYGALAWWFFSHAENRRNPSSIKPALDAVPSLAAGAVMSIALILAKNYDLLFGCWMLMYGLAQTTYTSQLTRGVYFTGIVYMVFGSVLAFQTAPFTDPWPMGWMFFLGEIAGGLCLLQQKEDLA